VLLALHPIDHMACQTFTCFTPLTEKKPQVIIVDERRGIGARLPRSEVTGLAMGLLHVEHWAILSGGQTLMLVALGLLATHVLVSRVPPRALYGLWLLVFVRLVVPWTPSISPRALPWLGHAWTVVADLWSPRPVAPRLLDPFEPLTGRPLEWAFIIWAIGVVVILSIRGAANWRWYRRIRRARPVDLTQSAGIATIPVFETSAVDRPVQVGVIRPRLLVPASLLQGLTEDEWSHVLLHEGSHARHRDLTVLWLVQTVCAFYWFNPAVWLALTRLSEARELAADYDALHALSSPTAARDYANTLVHLLDEPDGHPPMWSTTAGIGSTFAVYHRRVTQILRYGRPRQVWPAVLAAVVMLTVGISVGIPPLRPLIRTTFSLTPIASSPTPGRDEVYLGAGTQGWLGRSGTRTKSGELDPGLLGGHER
jgi:beta-lactamase regulating signal transducer with metallopeptidase domain